MRSRLTSLSSNNRFGQTDARNTLGMFVLASLGLQAAISLGTLLLVVAFIGLARKPAPTLVQVESGRSISVEALDSKERTPASVQKFTQDTVTLLMSASSVLPAANKDTQPQPDKGVELATARGSRRISSLAALAGFGLSEDFRTEFLKKLGELTPQEIFQGGGDQVVLVVQNVSKPEKVEDGKWKVTIIANLIRFSAGNQSGTGIAFNKDIYVRAVTPPAVGAFSTDLEKEIAQIRNAGLEIYAMRDFIRPNL